ncbi:MAG: protease inhibitor I42 family protein [Oscillospiraceae bacterium]|nr:protease inhibitor I42 family protein [Oscillospiraceae bacterium]
MKRIGVVLLTGLLILSGCASEEQPAEPMVDGPGMERSYQQIDQETAKQMMEQDDGHIVVDVRRLDEYEEGHIPGAICIPNESIDARQPAELPHLNQTILLYCRSGNRSKQAAEKLLHMGYARIYEFGGIIDWTGEIATGQTLTLTVEANPTTGFSWAAEQDQELFDIRDYYLAEPQSGPVSGAGGWQTFILTPKQAGTAQLSFTYSRPWEPSDTDPQFHCSLAVSEDLMITVTEDGSAEAAERGFPAVMRIY